MIYAAELLIMLLMLPLMLMLPLQPRMLRAMMIRRCCRFDARYYDIAAATIDAI